MESSAAHYHVSLNTILLCDFDDVRFSLEQQHTLSAVSKTLQFLAPYVDAYTQLYKANAVLIKGGSVTLPDIEQGTQVKCQWIASILNDTLLGMAELSMTEWLEVVWWLRLSHLHVCEIWLQNAEMEQLTHDELKLPPQTVRAEHFLALYGFPENWDWKCCHLASLDDSSDVVCIRPTDGLCYLVSENCQMERLKYQLRNEGILVDSVWIGDNITPPVRPTMEGEEELTMEELLRERDLISAQKENAVAMKTDIVASVKQKMEHLKVQPSCVVEGSNQSLNEGKTQEKRLEKGRRQLSLDATQNAQVSQSKESVNLKKGRVEAMEYKDLTDQQQRPPRQQQRKRKRRHDVDQCHRREGLSHGDMKVKRYDNLFHLFEERLPPVQIKKRQVVEKHGADGCEKQSCKGMLATNIDCDEVYAQNDATMLQIEPQSSNLFQEQSGKMQILNQLQCGKKTEHQQEQTFKKMSPCNELQMGNAKNDVGAQTKVSSDSRTNVEKSSQAAVGTYDQQDVSVPKSATKSRKSSFVHESDVNMGTTENVSSEKERSVSPIDINAGNTENISSENETSVSAKCHRNRSTELRTYNKSDVNTVNTGNSSENERWVSTELQTHNKSDVNTVNTENINSENETSVSAKSHRNRSTELQTYNKSDVNTGNTGNISTKKEMSVSAKNHRNQSTELQTQNKSDVSTGNTGNVSNENERSVSTNIQTDETGVDTGNTDDNSNEKERSAETEKITLKILLLKNVDDVGKTQDVTVSKSAPTKSHESQLTKLQTYKSDVNTVNAETVNSEDFKSVRQSFATFDVDIDKDVVNTQHLLPTVKATQQEKKVCKSSDLRHVKIVGVQHKSQLASTATETKVLKYLQSNKCGVDQTSAPKRLSFKDITCPKLPQYSKSRGELSEIKYIKTTNEYIIASNERKRPEKMKSKREYDASLNASLVHEKKSIASPYSSSTKWNAKTAQVTKNVTLSPKKSQFLHHSYVLERAVDEGAASYVQFAKTQNVASNSTQLRVVQTSLPSCKRLPAQTEASMPKKSHTSESQTVASHTKQPQRRTQLNEWSVEGVNTKCKNVAPGQKATHTTDELPKESNDVRGGAANAPNHTVLTGHAGAAEEKTTQSNRSSVDSVPKRVTVPDQIETGKLRKSGSNDSKSGQSQEQCAFLSIAKKESPSPSHPIELGRKVLREVRILETVLNCDETLADKARNLFQLLEEDDLPHVVLTMSNSQSVRLLAVAHSDKQAQRLRKTSRAISKIELHCRRLKRCCRLPWLACCPLSESLARQVHCRHLLVSHLPANNKSDDIVGVDVQLSKRLETFLFHYDMNDSFHLDSHCQLLDEEFLGRHMLVTFMEEADCMAAYKLLQDQPLTVFNDVTQRQQTAVVNYCFGSDPRSQKRVESCGLKNSQREFAPPTVQNVFQPYWKLWLNTPLMRRCVGLANLPFYYSTLELKTLMEKFRGSAENNEPASKLYFDRCFVIAEFNGTGQLVLLSVDPVHLDRTVERAKKLAVDPEQPLDSFVQPIVLTNEELLHLGVNMVPVNSSDAEKYGLQMLLIRTLATQVWRRYAAKETLHRLGELVPQARSFALFADSKGTFLGHCLARFDEPAKCRSAYKALKVMLDERDKIRESAARENYSFEPGENALVAVYVLVHGELARFSTTVLPTHNYLMWCSSSGDTDVANFYCTCHQHCSMRSPEYFKATKLA